MFSLALIQLCSMKDVAGIAGNIFALGLFVSPIQTFRRVIRNKSTEQFSGLPYTYALLNCLLTAWYGTPFISPDNLLITSVNSLGAVFQIVYIILFISCAEKEKKLRMLGLVVMVCGLTGILVAVSLNISDVTMRRIFIGFLSCASLISMSASPLFIIKLVIQTRSIEFMPFYLSLSTFLMSTAFFSYGLLSFDPFVYVPNGIGTILGIVQLGLLCYYRNASSEDTREPLLESYDM